MVTDDEARKNFKYGKRKIIITEEDEKQLERSLVIPGDYNENEDKEE